MTTYFEDSLDAATKAASDAARAASLAAAGGAPTDTAVANLVQGPSSTSAAIDSRGDARWVKWTGGHIGIERTNPQNARIYIGTGTGTLTDTPVMGIKVKIDAPTDGSGRSPDGIQSNVNVLDGAVDGSTRACAARLDISDTINTGDAVSLWADTWIATASARNTWGGNIYASIRPSVAYAGTMVGLEVGAENYGTVENDGGGLHVVGKSTGQKLAFGVSIGSDATAGGQPGAIAGAFRTHLLMRSGDAPSDNYIWVGPTTANIPSGNPLFQVDAAGNVGIGIPAQTSAVLAVGGSIRVGSTNGPRIMTGSGDPETVVSAGVGSIYLRTGGGASTTFYVKESGTGNTGWVAK